jgi:hypothetical protein
VINSSGLKVSIITSRQTPVHFWKYVSFFSKKETDKNNFELETDGNRLSQPCEFAEAFAAHFKSAFDNHCMRDFSTGLSN